MTQTEYGATSTAGGSSDVPQMKTGGDLIPLNGWRKTSTLPGALEDCSLIVPTFRRPAEIVTLLTAILDADPPPGEVVVVDGSPNDLTDLAISTWAKDRDLPFEFVYVKSPAGITRQRNVGIDATTRDLIFYLDDDCVPESGYFRDIRQVFHDDTSLAVGAVGGSIIQELDRPLSLRWRIRFWLGLVPRGRPGEYLSTATSVPAANLARFTGTKPVDVLTGASMAYRRIALAKQRFSHFFYGYSQGEDLEMSLRIGREWKLLKCGDALVSHYHAPSGRPASIQKGKMEVRNRFFIWKRYSPDVQIVDRIRFWMDITYIFWYDVFSFIAHPMQPWRLSHALGVVDGTASCFASPPVYVEPPARQEYRLHLADLNEETVDLTP